MESKTDEKNFFAESTPAAASDFLSAGEVWNKELPTMAMLWMMSYREVSRADIYR
jgi:hypothetical protein